MLSVEQLHSCISSSSEINYFIYLFISCEARIQLMFQRVNISSAYNILNGTCVICTAASARLNFCETGRLCKK